MNNELLLLSGGDIPFPAARLTIHQPKLYEIAYIGEEQFYKGCELLKFSKNNLITQDRINLENQSDFNIIMSIVNDKSSVQSRESTNALKMVLSLMFPSYQIIIRPGAIDFVQEIIDNNGSKHYESSTIDEKVYDTFKDILVSMFCLKDKKNEQKTFNPAGSLSAKIAEKLQKGRNKVAEKNGTSNKVAILSRYASILAVGEHKSLNDFMNYTIYQIMDEFERFNLKESHSMYIKAKLAGAKDMDEVENWMKDIHE